MKFVAVALATLSVAHSAAAYKGRHNEPQFRGRAIDHRAQLLADDLYDCAIDCIDDELDGSGSVDGESSIEDDLNECDDACVETAVESGTDRTLAQEMVDCLGKCNEDVAKTYQKEVDKAVDKAVEDCEDKCTEGDTECVDDCKSSDVTDVSTNSAEKKATKEGGKCYTECVGPEAVQDFKAALKASGKTTLKAIRQAEQSFARDDPELEKCLYECPEDEFGSSLDGSDLSDFSKSGDIEDDLNECSSACVGQAETRGLIDRAAAQTKAMCYEGCNEDAAKNFEKEVEKAISSAEDDCKDDCEESCDDGEDCDCDKECKSKDVSNVSVDGKKAIKKADKCYIEECGAGGGRYKAALKVARRKLA